MKKKNKFLQKLGRQGGKKTLEKYGVDHFKRIRALPRKEKLSTVEIDNPLSKV